jgi:hypothetical protein
VAKKSLIEEKHIYGLIEAMRRRPEMFTPHLTLSVIEDTLDGYSIALPLNGIEERYEGRKFDSMNFARWLFETRGWSASNGFADAISRHMQNREKAFALFIELAAEFRQSDPNASD